MQGQIRIEKSETLKAKPNPDQLGFGKYFTDHMFLMDYTEGKGWHDPRIVPYGPFCLDPAAMVFHYGQAVFEGLKAFKSADGKIRLFRPDRNAKRLNVSNNRMSIPEIDEALFLEAVTTLVKLEADWIPEKEGASLYIRPFIIATEAALGVHAARNYLFSIILTPVGSYYAGGLSPVKIHVENEQVRTVRGGVGIAKTAGNYAASIKAQEMAKLNNYEQVLWLDAIELKYIEEVGSMNVFFKINGEVITPQLTGSILAGITRDSIIQLLKHWNIPLVERKISIDEVAQAAKDGTLEEAFGTGTAAVISPIGELGWQGENYVINNGKIGELSQKLYDTLTGIQYGKVEDPFGWVVEL